MKKTQNKWWAVRVHFSDFSFRDEIQGRTPTQALINARENWVDASHVEIITRHAVSTRSIQPGKRLKPSIDPTITGKDVYTFKPSQEVNHA